MRKPYLGILAASTAMAVILTAGMTVAAPVLPSPGETSAPRPQPANMPAPSVRDITTSAPKPMQPAPSDSPMRFRSEPMQDTAQPNARVISPPPSALRTEQAQPASVAPAPTVSIPAAAPPAAVPLRSTIPATTAAPAKADPIAAAIVDVPINNKLRDLIANKQHLERLVPRKNERDAIAALYQNNLRFAPLWVDRGTASDRAQKAIAHLQDIDADGLDPADYPLPNLSANSAEALAEAELRFTAAVLTYARHAMNGRVHFSRVSPNIEFKEAFEPADALSKIASSGDLSRTLQQFNPQHAGYRALKAKLAEMRTQSAETGPAPIADGQVLRFSKDKQGREISMIDPRVPLIRERLGLAAEPGNAYNRTLADAVAKFQKARGLQVNGQLNSATLAALNPMNRSKQVETVLANLERWRWVPREFGRTHVHLNIPDFHLRVVNNNAQVWMTRVVVGKPTQATPLLSETIKYITVNPTWNVPQSIIYNELLPVYETSDRSVFDKMGLKVERKSNGEVRVYQPSGERNALGRIRFNFPNKFLVYQHDTPEKHYFAHDKRAYSHGCMRVQNPLKYAEVLLQYAAPRGNHTEESLRRMYGDEERTIEFQNHIPVHLTYQTAFVDDAGKLQFRDDIYGLDSKQLSLLNGEERKVADVSIERPADPNFKPTGEHRQRLQSAARGGGNPFSLFEQLFR